MPGFIICTLIISKVHEPHKTNRVDCICDPVGSHQLNMMKGKAQILS